LRGLKELGYDFLRNLASVSQICQAKFVLLIVEVGLSCARRNRCLEELCGLLPVVEDCEGLLVHLLLLPFVSLGCQLLAQQAIIKVVILGSCIGCLLLLLSESVQLSALILLIEISVLVGHGSRPVLALEEADLGHASQGVDDREVELVDDGLSLGDLDCLTVSSLAPVQIGSELVLKLLAEVGQLDQEMTEGNLAVRHMSCEGLLVFKVLHVAVLELQHLVVEDLAVHVTEKEGLVEFELRRRVEGTSHDLGGVLKY